MKNLKKLINQEITFSLTINSIVLKIPCITADILLSEASISIIIIDQSGSQILMEEVLDIAGNTPGSKSPCEVSAQVYFFDAEGNFLRSIEKSFENGLLTKNKVSNLLEEYDCSNARYMVVITKK